MLSLSAMRLTKIETQHVLIDELGLDLKQHGFIKEHLDYEDIESIALKHRVTKVFFAYRIVLALLTLFFALAWAWAILNYAEVEQVAADRYNILFPFMLVAPMSLGLIAMALIFSAFKKRWLLVIHTTSGHRLRININEVYKKGQLRALYGILRHKTALKGWVAGLSSIL